MLASEESLNVKDELQLMIRYQYWPIKYSKCTLLKQALSNMGNCGCAGMRGYVRTLYFLLRISVSNKTTLLIPKNQPTNNKCSTHLGAF